ncbi:helix-turn-helix domain-containing protein [Pseudonocardia nematodicida]|uniref:Helix-turn-helix domain-containing protein n=1 Tax=Pseudonocardia nematodicida TaxID=1206997 RepID=A0ABV1KGX8_9PSEU
MTHDVVVLARPGVIPVELSLANLLFTRARSVAGEPYYRVRSCALRPGRLETDADFTVVVDHGPEILREAGTVILPATHRTDEEPGVLDDGLGDALGGLAPGTRIASICTAAFALAAADLLDGRRATTHWQSAAHFRRRFPQVLLDPDVLFVDNGEILTSAGEAAGVDLCLHLIRRDCGRAVANDVARRTVLPPFREGGQAPYIPRPGAVADGVDSSTRTLQEWMLEDLTRQVTVEDLAARMHVSPRTLTRRFRADVGQSPLDWLVRQRVGHARELLELTDLPVEQIAARSGFGTAAGMRRHFTAVIGMSPRSYRATFRGPADDGR